MTLPPLPPNRRPHFKGERHQVATRLAIPVALRLREVAYAKGHTVDSYLESLVLADLELNKDLDVDQKQEQLPMTG